MLFKLSDWGQEILNYVNEVSSDYSTTRGYRLTGRMVRNYHCVVENRFDDLEIRRMFRTLYISDMQ